MAGKHTLTVGLEDFAWEAVQAESLQLGVSAEELVRFSVLYYLADHDADRLARRLPAPHAPGPPPGERCRRDASAR